MTNTMTTPAIPSYDDVCSSFSRIRADGGVMWDVEHPLRAFELAAQRANIHRSCERMAAYRLMGATVPTGYIDSELANLHAAMRLLLSARDQGAPWSLRDGADTAEMLGL